MASTTRKSRKSSAKSELVCRWCEKQFSSERTLAKHMCVKKRRWTDREMSHIQLAYRVYQRFYEVTTNSNKPKTMEDFIRSQFYMDFVKFGRSCKVNEYLNPPDFAEWLISRSVPLRDWCTDATYNQWLLEFVKKEPGTRALERTIKHMDSWANMPEYADHCWQDYFSMVSANRAVHDMRSGKISPWVIYLSETGPGMLTRLNTEQIQCVDHIIDADFWLKVFRDQPHVVEEIQNTCQIAGI